MIAALVVIAHAGCTVDDTTPACGRDDGCFVCTPGRAACDDEKTVRTCTAGGDAYDVVACTDGEWCLDARCRDLCAEARARGDYLGCELWAAPLPTPLLSAEGYSFAIVVANGQPFEAELEVLRGGRVIEARTIAPHATAVVRLPWIPAHSRVGTGSSSEDPIEPVRSVIVVDGAYRVVASVPVTVTQWSPLEHRSTAPGCERAGPACRSETNDASLLFPVHALGTEHRVVSYTTIAHATEDDAGLFRASTTARGTFSVIATEPGETNVRVVAAAALEGLEGEARIEPGEERRFALSQGDVLSMVAARPASEAECMPVGRRRQCASASLDPTGTLVDSDRPVAVFSGHECANVPFDRRACDHLEEQLLPVSALGRSYVLAPHVPIERASEALNRVRVVAAEDAVAVRFEPALHDDVTLDAGAWIELEMREPFRVESTGRLLVAQYGVGGDFDVTGPAAPGDPSMVIVAPEAQWQPSYLVHVPGSYTSAFVTVIVRAESTLTIDGRDSDAAASMFGAYRVERVTLAPEEAAHRIESSLPFAAIVHGYAPWTSYMHLGGLRVAPLID